jgi:hypothetical protein
MSNKFASAFKQKQHNIIEEKSHVSETTSKQVLASSRSGAKHIGGYFDPVVSKQLRSIAIDEDSSIQSLMAEALDMLFQSRGKPMIAEKNRPL